MRRRFIQTGFESAFIKSSSGWDGDVEGMTFYECELTQELKQHLPAAEAGRLLTVDLVLKRSEVEVRTPEGELLLCRHFSLHAGDEVKAESYDEQNLSLEALVNKMPSHIAIELPFTEGNLCFGFVCFGEQGYHPLRNVKSLREADLTVKSTYRSRLPTPQQRKAAAHACLYGWHTPKANPDHPAHQ